MDNVKNIVIGALAVLAIVFGVSAAKSPVIVGSAGQTHSFPEFFQQGITVGGDVRATSTTGTVVPLLATDFDNEAAIDVTANVSSVTLSFPASSTLSIIPNPGDTKKFVVRNATTTAATSITFSGGTGMLFKKATTTAVLPGDTDGANYANIILTRKANRDVEVLYNGFTD